MSSRPSTFVLTQPGPLRLYSTGELLTLPPPTWLIEGILPTGGLVGLIGPPGAGKTFIALDMALSVSAGGLWQGNLVKQGYVLYISAEGNSGIGKRVKAWLVDRGVRSNSTNIAWLLEAVPIHAHSDGIDILLERINELEVAPALVIIDTMARCFDGDENQQEDMGRFVAGVDRLRLEFGATVIVVHHTRLDGDRERGNTAFRGAADTMIFVTRDSTHAPLELVCNKQKDAEEFEPISLRLKSVPETDSCVVAIGRKQKVEVKINELLNTLSKRGPLTFEEWAHEAEALDLSKSTFKRYLVSLRENHQIIKQNGKYARLGGAIGLTNPKV